MWYLLHNCRRLQRPRLLSYRLADLQLRLQARWLSSLGRMRQYRLIRLHWRLQGRLLPLQLPQQRLQ